VKTPVVERGPKGAQNAVAKVDFNINPGYKKPTATVTDFSLKTGAKFEYTMARSYPCFITVHFKKEWGLPQVDIQYVVQDDPKTSRRIVVDMPVAALGSKRPGQVSVEPRNGWIQCVAGQQPVVQYIGACTLKPAEH
jgi:hypothetical protein